MSETLSVEKAKELIKQEYPALFSDYYQKGDMEGLQGFDTHHQLRPANQRANLPQRYEALMKKIPEAIAFLKDELAQQPSEIAHSASDSEYTTGKISAVNIKEREANRRAINRGYNTVYHSVIEAPLPGEKDTLTSLFSNAEQVQHAIDCERENKPTHTVIGRGHFQTQLASVVLDAYMHEAGLETPQKSARR